MEKLWEWVCVCVCGGGMYAWRELAQKVWHFLVAMSYEDEMAEMFKMTVERYQQCLTFVPASKKSVKRSFPLDITMTKLAFLLHLGKLSSI